VRPLALLFAVALAGACVAVAVRPAPSRSAAARRAATPLVADVAPRPLPRPAPKPKPEPRRLVARILDRAALRSRPGGPVLAVAETRTEFGSPTALAVVRRRGPWLGVLSPALPNGRLGWIDARAARLRLAQDPLRLDADLSRRTLAVVRGTHVLRRLAVAVGAAGSPTPTGRFAVTDVLPGARFSSVYGCCILALSGRQTHTPAGWSNGDRLAIHGGAGLGSAVSAGCLHASEADLRYLVRLVSPGTVVTVHR
jgi:hypothetical protein